MHAEVEGSSPPPHDSPSSSTQVTSSKAGTLLPLPTHAPATTAPAKGGNKRRKVQGAAAPSPAPSDNTGGGNNPNDLLATSRADLSSRPILTISRGPIFVPVAEGSEWCKTEMVGVNRVGFRYVPAGIKPPGHAAPCRTIESNPTCFRVSWEDRSPFLKVTKDGLGIAGSKGFRSARCNAPIREGKWYMEVKILHGGGEHISEESHREGSHVRLGWGRREASLNGPVGLDGYSYGYRDKTGEKVTLSRPRPYGRPFGTGDVVGMYISLPPRRQPNKKDPHDPAHLKRERIPIDLKGQEVFEILEYPVSKEMTSLMDYSGKTTSSASVPSSSKKMANGKIPERNGPAVSGAKPVTPTLRPLPTLPDSRIAFFVNGECQGVAFEDLYDYLPLRQTEAQKANSRKRLRDGVKEHKENPFDDGTLGYYPFISLFNDASVRLNPGPHFEFPPPDDIDALLENSKPAAANTSDNAHLSVPSVPPPQEIPTKNSTENSTFDMDLGVKQPEDIKPVINPETSDVQSPVAPPKAEFDLMETEQGTNSHLQQQRKWRPANERYPEFMEEEWAFDEFEEQEAKVELEKFMAAEKAEEDRRKQREKKRLQAEAKRKAKAAVNAKQLADAALLQEEKAREREREMEMEMSKERETKPTNGVHHLSPTSTPISSGLLLGPGGLYAGNYPSPSPLRHSTAYEPEGSVEYENSPAPTFASYGDFLPEPEPEGAQSGYTTENQELPDDMDVDQDLAALLDAPSRTPSTS